MRMLNISNEKKRDAAVGMENKKTTSKIYFALKDGSPKKNVRILKGTLPVELDALVSKFGDLHKVGESIIENDPEIDFENTGRVVAGTRKLYLNAQNRIAYRVNLVEVVKNPDGTEKERKELHKTEANILNEIPLKWTGVKIPKDKAVRKFVFSLKYQIKHVNGLTYDFLYDMAKNLEESNSLMLVGGGKKGTDPIVLTGGGTPYRGFLEGRIKDDKYCLILHLTNLELKELGQ
ncbi:hypothetical protein [Acetivibrio cellulolyticus]|uniref:hypothetical protein n=1 Tax=Acetivibrio cellulolyticus TaxID=35830 RepID=UPI0001E2EC39|nr:hypothetical protein [Acetivibrio cellulolyticus]